MYTEEQWEQYAKMENALYDLAQNYVSQWGEDNPGESVNSAQFDGSTIYIETEASWAYGGHADNSYNIPISYLWTEDWREIESAKRKKANDLIVSEQNRQAEYDKEKAEAEEKAQYLKLQQKYGGAS